MTTVLNQPNQIAAARLAAAKGRIKIEKAGMKFRGGSTRALMAAELGLKPRDSHDKFIAVIDAKIEELIPGFFAAKEADKAIRTAARQGA